MTKKVLIIGACGHIGSRLYQELESDLDLELSCLDIELRGNPGIPNVIRKDYSRVSEEFLKDFDVVVFLAATSSVKTCTESPRQALQNNVLHFFDLLQKLNSHQKFIYASSSSVYTGTGDKAVDENWSQFHVANMYDLTKYAGDALVPLYCKAQYYGLRFGTVCGYSPNERSEVMIQAMLRSAIRTSTVSLQNGNCHRPILGLKDLCRAVQAIIHQDQDSGIYNLASFVSTIKDVATEVARLTLAKVQESSGAGTYDFSMSSDKFAQTFDFEFRDSVRSIVDEILEGDEWKKELSGKNFELEQRL